MLNSSIDSIIVFNLNKFMIELSTKYFLMNRILLFANDIKIKMPLGDCFLNFLELN